MEDMETDNFDLLSAVEVEKIRKFVADHSDETEVQVHSCLSDHCTFTDKALGCDPAVWSLRCLQANSLRICMEAAKQVPGPASEADGYALHNFSLSEAGSNVPYNEGMLFEKFFDHVTTTDPIEDTKAQSMIARAAEDPSSLAGSSDDLASIISYANTIHDKLICDVVVDTEGKRLLVEHGEGDKVCERGNILLARQLEECKELLDREL